MQSYKYFYYPSFLLAVDGNNAVAIDCVCVCVAGISNVVANDVGDVDAAAAAATGVAVVEIVASFDAITCFFYCFAH